MRIQKIPSSDYEEIWEAQDASQNFHAFIVLHSLKRGPAIGGLRFWKYPDSQAALEDAQELARAMTYKAALARLPHGGGKAVMIEPNTSYERRNLMKLFGQFIDQLNGRYITAKDVGSGASDMEIIKQETPWVTGLAQSHGGMGDPSEPTAKGVALGIETCLDYTFKNRPQKIRIAIQGLGGVGRQLSQLLSQKSYEVWGTDVSAKSVFACSQLKNFHSVLPESIFKTPCEIFAPCALGNVISQENISQLNCKIVAGSANNPLRDAQKDANTLHQKGILYAPDFVINAGGLLHVAAEFTQLKKAELENQLNIIPQNLKKIFDISESEHLNPLQAALQMAEEILKN
ncbi:MAG: Glu/Leu/Phe/Val dehydrogenase [Deltaproteobacteria bacterium]|nr:Glu/Leu/Phe/Val dehydrogenase [Deltaproteobacteria bacterium]